jgi:hypothetical protein
MERTARTYGSKNVLDQCIRGHLARSILKYWALCEGAQVLDSHIMNMNIGLSSESGQKSCETVPGLPAVPVAYQRDLGRLYGYVIDFYEFYPHGAPCGV